MAPDREALLERLKRAKHNCDARLLERALTEWGFEMSETKSGYFFRHRLHRDITYSTHRPKGDVKSGAVRMAIEKIEEVRNREDNG